MNETCIKKFVSIIEDTSHKAYRVRDEKSLQEYIIQYVLKTGYRAINENIMKKKLLYHQPLMDVVIEIDGYLHGAELKLIRMEKYTPYIGLDQALAYSLNGVDYSWLIHYLDSPVDINLPMSMGEGFMLERILNIFSIRQVGYILVDPYGVKYSLLPRKRIDYDDKAATIRKKILSLLKHTGT